MQINLATILTISKGAMRFREVLARTLMAEGEDQENDASQLEAMKNDLLEIDTALGTLCQNAQRFHAFLEGVLSETEGRDPAILTRLQEERDDLKDALDQIGEAMVEYMESDVEKSPAVDPEVKLSGGIYANPPTPEVTPLGHTLHDNAVRQPAVPASPPQ